MALAMLVLTIAKLVLVSHHEIAVRSYDDSGFARSGAVGYWSPERGLDGFVRQPVYPVYLRLCSRAGLPQRPIIEIVWAGACLVLVRAMRSAGTRPSVALAAGALSLFYPPTFIWFDRLAQDNLYAPLALVFVVSIATAAGRRSRRSAWRWSLLACVAGALAANTRPESILLDGAVGVAATIAFIEWRWSRAGPAGAGGGRQLRRRLIVSVLAPLLSIQAFTLALAEINRARFGVRVTSELTMPGFKRLYNALLSIPPDPRPPRDRDPRLPITRDVRERAYAASPSFAVLRPWLDGEHRVEDFAQACRNQTGADGEFGAWTVWALRAAARLSRGADPWSSAAPLDRFYRRAADEIAAAQRDGLLARRAVPLSFVPPLWPELLAGWPGSLRATWRLIADVPYQRMYSVPAPAPIKRNFDIAARRRAATSAIVDRDPDSLARLQGTFWYNAPTVRALDRVKSGFVSAYRVIMPATLWVGLAGAVAALFAARRGQLRRSLLRLSVLLWSALLARVLLISLMDVTGLPVLARYVLVCGPMLIALALIGAEALVAALSGPSPREAEGDGLA